VICNQTHVLANVATRSEKAAMLDFTATGIQVAVLGAAGGVVTYFLNQLIVERYRAAVRTRRLRDALLVDCVEILERVNHLPFQFHRTPGEADYDDLRQVRKHPNGFVICGPLSETRELVTLLDRQSSRLVVRFFERSQMFATLESRYAAVYQKLLDTAAQCADGSGERPSLRELKEEYWEQLRSSLAAMHTAGQDLCLFACRLFQKLGRFPEAKLAEHSAGRWQTWSEFETELRGYAEPTPSAHTEPADPPPDDASRRPAPIVDAAHAVEAPHVVLRRISAGRPS
jgi:hypothetical protein